jgi:hypothetical protein
MSAKLLGFAAVAEIMDHERFAMVIRAELETVRNLLGSNMIVISGANTKLELIFLRTCIEFRVPTIVLLKNIDPLIDEENSKLRHSLLSVSLATYLLPSSTPANSIPSIYPLTGLSYPSLHTRQDTAFQQDANSWNFWIGGFIIEPSPTSV